jgi:hypothetical protein
MALTGTHLVRVLRSGLQGARHFWPRVGDRMEVRRNALKLRFWGQRHGQGRLLDLTYESIKAMAGSGVYELRIDDVIGGHRNIRVVFFDPPGIWEAQKWIPPLPLVWVLEALPKKRHDWTSFDIDRFGAKQATIKERFY